MSGSSTQQQNQTQNSTSNPWSVQTPFLTDAFNQAQGLSTNSYSGDRVAQFTPDQLATFQRMVGAGNMPTGYNQTAIGSSMASTGANAATGALNSLGSFTPQGGTQSNIDSANAYANAAASPDAVAAAMRDATRQVSEQALPQIARDSAMSGNTMSSRRGIAEGIVQRGLADKTADTSATMHANAFGQGLNLAEQNSEANNNAMLQAIQARGSLGSNVAASGNDATNSGVNNIAQLLGLGATGGAGEQAAGQAGLSNDMAKSDAAWQALQNYYGVVGGNSWGGTSSGTSNGTTQNTPSAWQVIGGLLSAGGSFMKSDRRVKTDIYEMPWRAANDLPVYTFRYKGDPTKRVHIGLMAQDVALVKPEAVKTIDGVMHVNYELALAE